MKEANPLTHSEYLVFSTSERNKGTYPTWRLLMRVGLESSYLAALKGGKTNPPCTCRATCFSCTQKSPQSISVRVSIALSESPPQSVWMYQMVLSGELWTAKSPRATGLLSAKSSLTQKSEALPSIGLPWVEIRRFLSRLLGCVSRALRPWGNRVWAIAGFGLRVP